MPIIPGVGLLHLSLELLKLLYGRCLCCNRRGNRRHEQQGAGTATGADLLSHLRNAKRFRRQLQRPGQSTGVCLSER